MMNPIMIDALVRERERERTLTRQRPRLRSWRRTRQVERPDTPRA